MTWADGAILLILGVSAILAYSRGLVREVLGVGAWAGALVLAFVMLPGMRSALGAAVSPAWLADVVVVGSVFVIALIILKLLIAWVARAVQSSVLGGVDRALGTVFGIARGAFLVVLAYILAGQLQPVTERWPEALRDARALPFVAQGAKWLVGQLPPEYRLRVPDAPARPLPPMEDLLRPPARNRT